MEVNFFERDQLQVQDQRHLKKVFLDCTKKASEAPQKGLLMEVHFFDNETNYRYCTKFVDLLV